MDSVVDYWGPVIYWMAALQTSLIALGAEIVHQAKDRLETTCRGVFYRAAGVFDQMKNKTSNVYQGIHGKAGGIYGKAGGIYSDLHRNAGDTYQDVQEKANNTWHSWLNSINLASIQSSLRLNLVLNRISFQISFFFKDLKSKLLVPFHFNISSSIKDFFNLRQNSSIKVTRWKKKVAETAKLSLEKLSKRAREYEDIMNDKLQRITPPSDDKKPFDPIHGPEYEDIDGVNCNLAMHFKNRKLPEIKDEDKNPNVNEDDEEFEEISNVKHEYEDVKFIKKSSSGRAILRESQVGFYI